MDISKRCPKHSEATASRIIDDEAVIVLPDEGTVEILNETGALIWQLSDGRRSVENIASLVASEFEVSDEEARSDVETFVNELVSKGIMVL
jgi:pyrroloquinoline quinone biosynthesis protein D